MLDVSSVAGLHEAYCLPVPVTYTQYPRTVSGQRCSTSQQTCTRTIRPSRFCLGARRLVFPFYQHFQILYGAFETVPTGQCHRFLFCVNPQLHRPNLASVTPTLGQLRGEIFPSVPQFHVRPASTGIHRQQLIRQRGYVVRYVPSIHSPRSLWSPGPIVLSTLNSLHSCRCCFFSPLAHPFVVVIARRQGCNFFQMRFLV